MPPPFGSLRKPRTPRGSSWPYINKHIYIYIYIYIYRYEKGPLWRPLFWHILCRKKCSHLGHIHVFKFMRCFAMAKQHFQYAHVNHKGSMGNDGETTLEKGICMLVGFLHEKGVYIMSGRRVPNLLVLTSLKKAGFQIWSY